MFLDMGQTVGQESCSYKLFCTDCLINRPYVLLILRGVFTPKNIQRALNKRK